MPKWTMPVPLINLSHENLRKRRGAVVFGDTVYKPGGIYGPRIQRDYQLVILHSGSLDLRLDDGRVHAEAGQALLLSPGHREHFYFSLDRQTHHSWCAVDVKAVPRALRPLLRKARGPAAFAGSLPALFQTGRVTAAFGDESLQAGFYLGLGLALLCGFALGVHADEARKTPCALALSRMENFIHNEYGGSLSLGDIARASGASGQHLARLCREAGIAPPVERLYAKRLEAAAELLLRTGLSVGEVAGRCGFASVFHFSRRFKQAYDKPPLAFRKSRWAAQQGAQGRRLPQLP